MLTQHKWIHFPNFAQFKDLLFPMQFKPKKGVIVTKHLIDQFFPLVIKVFGFLPK
jgi:hypothetical protein